MRVLLYAATILAFLCGGSPVFAQGMEHDVEHQDLHTQNHEKYKEWETPSGSSCCDEKDCRQVPCREGINASGETEFHAFILGQWRRVPPLVVRPYASPDFEAHACYWADYDSEGGYVIIRCFVAPRNS